MKNKIIVKIKDYQKFIHEHGHNQLYDNHFIITDQQFPKFLNISEEILEGKETEYQIVKDDIDHVLINFSSKSKTEYRLDLFLEPNTNTYHIGFSLFNNNLDHNYHEETNKNESIDVFSRIYWILVDLNKDVEYCIGATGDPLKDKIYQYILRYVSGWEKRTTNQYELGWGIYFKTLNIKQYGKNGKSRKSFL